MNPIELRIGFLIGKKLDLKRIDEILYTHENKQAPSCKVVLDFMEMDPEIFLNRPFSSTEQVPIKDPDLLEAELSQLYDFVWVEVLGGIERHGHPSVTISGTKYEGKLIHTLDKRMFIFLQDIISDDQGIQLLEKILHVPKPLQWLVLPKKDGKTPPPDYILDEMEQWIRKLIAYKIDE
ncbi:hypothetical protein [Brevibacillus sp. Leaf182]|uniref:hypothetical protein n=1 Tax=Brevibacillus sp. Leaf182 TaxID=1736290 RepID=UPI0007016E04|nr:hypothetical protein [Brevibacillus sp. Leaf182]RAT96794.1 hypothetical protein ASG16_013965 [Brevibacillus sp. Leaf182]